VSRTDGGGSQCKHQVAALLLSPLYFCATWSVDYQLTVIWFLWASTPLLQTGKEGGGGVQHGSSVSADDERQEQYPGLYISSTTEIAVHLVISSPPVGLSTLPVSLPNAGILVM
jgi:hypothetical protein